MEELFSKSFMDNFREMNNRCVHYRGAFIHLSTLIESVINIILVKYFCDHDKTKAEELLYSVFASERITMAHKVQVVQFIYRQHFKEFDKLYNRSILETFSKRTKAEKKANPNATKPATLDSKLDEFIKIRNKLAHRNFYKDEKEILEFDGTTISIDAKVIKGGEWNDDKLDLSEESVKSIQASATEIQRQMQELLILIEERNKRMASKNPENS